MKMTNGQRLAALYCVERGGFDASRGVVALLEHAVFQLFGIKLPEIKKTVTGKPYFPERPDIFFSLSHTTTHLLAAVSDSPVGADIETIRPVRAGVSERVCAPPELRQFDFFELWVLKESFIKVTGETRVNLRDLCFRRDGGQIKTPDCDVRARLFDAVPGCAAAVCVKGGEIHARIVMVDPAEIFETPSGPADGALTGPEITGRVEHPHTSMDVPKKPEDGDSACLNPSGIKRMPFIFRSGSESGWGT